MGKPDSYNVLMGVFRYCQQQEIPADSRAIQKVLFKLSQLCPNLLDSELFDEKGFSQELANDIENMMLNGMIGMSGEKLEILVVNPDIRKCFEDEISSLFSKYQHTQMIKMAHCFSKLLKGNESARYKRLINK